MCKIFRNLSRKKKKKKLRRVLGDATLKKNKNSDFSFGSEKYFGSANYGNRNQQNKMLIDWNIKNIPTISRAQPPYYITVNSISFL